MELGIYLSSGIIVKKYFFFPGDFLEKSLSKKINKFKKMYFLLASIHI